MLYCTDDHWHVPAAVNPNTFTEGMNDATRISLPLTLKAFVSKNIKKIEEESQQYARC